jgi:signal transduction histidine kinase
MFHSIRWRLLTSYVLLTLLAVCAVGILAMWAVRYYVQQQEIRYLTANAETIARQAQPLILAGERRAELDQLARSAAFFGNVRVLILDARRQTLADSGPPGQIGEAAMILVPQWSQPGAAMRFEMERWIIGLIPADTRFPSTAWSENQPPFLGEPAPDRPAFTIIRQAQGLWGSRILLEGGEEAETTQPDDEFQFLASAPRSARTVSVVVGDEAAPQGYVELSGGVDFSQEALATTRRAFWVAGAVAVLLAGVLGLLMGNRLSAPLVQLTETTARMSTGDLSVRAEVGGQDEIGRLAEQFNSMAGQLQASFAQLSAERDALRRFIADASHELRTPITALKNFNQLLIDGAGDDPQTRQEFLVESQAQIERLEWITQNLLDLSRLDAGLAELDLSDYDAREILQTALSSFKSRAGEKNVRLSLKLAEQPVSITCDRARLELALSNLLDNALKFSAQGGSVEAGVAEIEGVIRIWVRDDGPGIHPEDLPHIFKRFYSGRHNRQPGSGLGLSIVESIVQAHGARVEVETEPGQGATFSLVFRKRV